MLKIKDSVDLKELEKFKFKPKYDEDTGEVIYYYREYYSNPPYWGYDKDCVSRLEIYVESRIFHKTKKHREIKDKKEFKIILGRYARDFDIFEIFFDLIQAGLVEKGR